MLVRMAHVRAPPLAWAEASARNGPLPRRRPRARSCRDGRPGPSAHAPPRRPRTRDGLWQPALGWPQNHASSTASRERARVPSRFAATNSWSTECRPGISRSPSSTPSHTGRHRASQRQSAFHPRTSSVARPAGNRCLRRDSGPRRSGLRPDVVHDPSTLPAGPQGAREHVALRCRAKSLRGEETLSMWLMLGAQPGG